MGNYMYKKCLLSRREIRILAVGLDSVGKTTLLYKLKLGKILKVIPTVGFNVETIEHNNVKVTCWDVGLREKMRPLLRCYLPGSDGIVFMIDSTDRERLEFAVKDLLEPLSKEDDLVGVPVLVLANKQDLTDAMTPEEITENIENSGFLKEHPWKVFGTSVLMGDGLNESLDWLTGAITEDKRTQFIDELENSANRTTESVEVPKQNLISKDITKLSYFTNVCGYFIYMFLDKWFETSPLKHSDKRV